MLRHSKRCLEYQRSDGSQREANTHILSMGECGPYRWEPSVPHTGRTCSASLSPPVHGCLGIVGIRKKRQSHCHLHTVRFSLHLALKKLNRYITWTVCSPADGQEKNKHAKVSIIPMYQYWKTIQHNHTTFKKATEINMKNIPSSSIYWRNWHKENRKRIIYRDGKAITYTVKMSIRSIKSSHERNPNQKHNSVAV